MRHTERRRLGRAWIATAGLTGALVLAPAVLSAQDLTLHGTTNVRGQETPVTMFFSAPAMRSTTGDSDIIVRLDAKKIFAIDARQKTYSEMTFADVQKATGAAAAAGMENLPPEAAAKMKQMMGGMPGGDVTVTPMGAGETIAGYATQKYHLTMGSAIEMDVWAAPALMMPTVYYDAMKAMVPRSPMLDMTKLFDAFKRIKGTHLKSVMNMTMMGQTVATTTVITSVDRGAIPAATFQVPAGYKSVPMRLQ